MARLSKSRIQNKQTQLAGHNAYLAQGDYSFLEFYVFWLESNPSWMFPDIHETICSFFDSDDWGESETKVLLLARGIGKSSLIDLWIAYKLSKDPALRFLVMSADLKSAKRATKDILNIINKHSMCSHLRSTAVEQTTTHFFVRGCTDPRNPNVSAHGITSNVTSGRADYIVYDDVEVMRNSGNEGKRGELRRRIGEVANLLIPETSKPDACKRVVIGTYNDTISIYEDEKANGAAVLEVPLIRKPIGDYPTMTGITIWSEKYNDEWVLGQQKKVSRAMWYSQYLLIPMAPEDAELDATLLQVYDEEIEFKDLASGLGAWIRDDRLSSVSCFWDPSLAQANTDASVLSLVYTSDKGRYYIHRTIGLKGDVHQQCREVKRVAIEFGAPVVTIETNGIGNFLPDVLRQTLQGSGIVVEGRVSRGKKQDRILEAYESRLYGHYIYVSREVYTSKFYQQFKDFKSTLTRQRDDYIDSAASAILLEPVNILNSSFTVGSMENNWQDRSEGFEYSFEYTTL